MFNMRALNNDSRKSLHDRCAIKPLKHKSNSDKIYALSIYSVAGEFSLTEILLLKNVKEFGILKS